MCAVTCSSAVQYICTSSSLHVGILLCTVHFSKILSKRNFSNTIFLLFERNAFEGVQEIFSLSIQCDLKENNPLFRSCFIRADTV